MLGLYYFSILPVFLAKCIIFFVLGFYVLIVGMCAGVIALFAILLVLHYIEVFYNKTKKLWKKKFKSLKIETKS